MIEEVYECIIRVASARELRQASYDYAGDNITGEEGTLLRSRATQ